MSNIVSFAVAVMTFVAVYPMRYTAGLDGAGCYSALGLPLPYTRDMMERTGQYVAVLLSVSVFVAVRVWLLKRARGGRGSGEGSEPTG